jgi:translation initiation factor 1
MAKKREERTPDLSGGKLTHNPFAALSGGSPSARPAAESATPVPSEAGSRESLFPGRVVVRREAKGRGGKTITRVSGLGADAAAVDELARDLKRALGVGAHVEDGDVLVQGNLTERVAVWLEKRGAGKVVRGN